MSSVESAVVEPSLAKPAVAKPYFAKPYFADHLSIRVAQASGESNAASFVAHQYATYPFRLSGNLRLDSTDPHRVYAYIMNAAPGILAGDDLRLRIEVGDRASLYLTDQSATKVHSHPAGSETAKMSLDLTVGSGAYLEYIPEPVILFGAAALQQRMQVTLHPQGRLVLSEIVVPGRMAREEFYDFEQFQSRLRVQTPDGKLCFADNFRLLGKANRFKQSPFLADFPIVANLVAVVPGVAIAELSRSLQDHGVPEETLQVSDSSLPGCNGLWIRAIATQASAVKVYQRHLLNCVRQLTGNATLPPIPK